MQATRALREKMAQLLAEDPDTLAPPADANVIALVMAEFTPSEGTVLGDLTLADFVTSTPLAVVVGTQPEGLDPNNADALITLSPPAGGFRWETTALTNLPQTIYGFALLNDALDTLLACEVLEEPVTLTAVNQVVELGAIGFRQIANSLT